MANYELYEDDNSTPIAIPQPTYATWESTPIGEFTNGVQRLARYKRVRWEFERMTQDEYTQLVANRPDSGIMQFKTFRGAVGATPAEWVQCAGIMGPILGGNLHDGEVYGVYVEWTRVETV